MRLLPDVCWGDGDTGSKLLGLYEDELHDILYQQWCQPPTAVINLGSAEGYYAVGLGRALAVPVVASDIDSRAQDITQRTAQANGVVMRVMGAMTAEQFDAVLSETERPLVVMDIEGAEHELLDPAAVPHLKRARILVESHDCFRAGITQQLLDRFESSHTVQVIRAQGKDPWQFEFLDSYTDLEKLILVNECRPETARWIWMTPQ